MQQVHCFIEAVDGYLSVRAVQRNPDLAELIDRAAGPASRQKIDEFWRTLVENNAIVTRIEREGVKRGSLRDNAAALAKVQKLLSRVGDPDRIARALALQQTIERTNPALAKLAPPDIAMLIERGMSNSKPAKEGEREVTYSSSSAVMRSRKSSRAIGVPPASNRNSLRSRKRVRSPSISSAACARMGKSILSRGPLSVRMLVCARPRRPSYAYLISHVVLCGMSIAK